MIVVVFIIIIKVGIELNNYYTFAANENPAPTKAIHLPDLILSTRS